PSWAAAQHAAATPFWLLPKMDVDLRSLAPAAVELVAAPDPSREFAVLQVAGELDAKKWTLEYRAPKDRGYGVVPSGLQVGAPPYGDREYKIEKLPAVFAGLTLLQTRMGHKGVLDGRYA